MKTGIDPAAIATEIRVGHLNRENAFTKARRLLVEGRVRIRRLDDHGLLADVAGDSGAIRTVVYEHGLWSCDCEARGRCSHELAVQLVVAIPRGAGERSSRGA